MRARDSIVITGVSAAGVSATVSSLHLDGGEYGMSLVVGGGSAQLFKVGPNGSATVPIGSSGGSGTTTYQTIKVPNGGYQLTLTSATAVYADITRIPGE